MATLAAFLFTLAARGLGRIPAPYLAGQRPLTGLLIGANVGAFAVASVAGLSPQRGWGGIAGGWSAALPGWSTSAICRSAMAAAPTTSRPSCTWPVR